MNKKIVGILICMLLIGTSFVVTGNITDEIYQKQNYENEINKIDYKTSQNGVILDQALDEDGKGHTVISIWGSYYEMGYAQAELLGDYIVQGLQEFKDRIGKEDYYFSRTLASEAVWIPTVIEDEINGIVDCLAITHPSENIDELDVKALQTAGEWWYQGCRGHTCWGRYVAEPIKTLSTVRLDWPATISSLYHHLICVHDPNDGSPQWISFGWPGVVAVVTGVNEFGTVIRIQDYNSHDLDMISGRVSRGIISRYATTYVTSPDVSTHLADVYTELQNYEVMSGGFLNYYAPEGHGGVFTSNPFQSGPDFYHIRTPQESWHHGEAMVTTNTWTDGTYTPSDEDFGVDSYYDDESPKTQESHWDLLNKTGWHLNLHMVSVAYRSQGDMTIWFEGRIGSKRTPRLEWEWEDLFFKPPLAPNIDGPTSGAVGKEQEYVFEAIDPDGDDVSYCIDWGDNSSEVCIGPFPSGTEQTSSHTWDEEGTYIIRAKTKDIHGAESDWAYLEVSMPKNKVISLQLFLQRFFQRFAMFEKILNQIVSLENQ
jgi:hypothetical protein